MRKRVAIEKARQLNERGIDEVQAGQFAEAEESFRSAIENWPEYASAWDNLGVSLMHQGRYSEALSVLYRAMDLDPDDPNCRYNLALLLADHGVDIAMDQFQTCLRLDPEFPDASYYLGALYTNRNEKETALQYFHQALETNPDDTRPLVWLARNAFEEGDYEKSITLCQKVLDMEPNPSDPEVYIGLAHSYGALGEFDRAEEYFEQYVVASPYDPYGHYLLACIYAMRDQRDLALQSLEDALNLSHDEVRDWAREDPRLDSIRHDLRFVEMIGEE